MNVRVEEPLDRRDVFYSSKRPPPTIAEAQVHLEWLTRQVYKIEAKLEYRETEDYESDEEFSLWKDRAARRLGIYKADKEFLEKWLVVAIQEQQRKTEAVRRENERVQREKDEKNRPSQEALVLGGNLDIVGMLVKIAREAYRGGSMSPQYKAFFEATFAP